MASRRSLFDDLMAVTAKFPWWVGIVLAVIAYIGFHAFATRPNPMTPQNVAGLGEFARHRLWKTIATFLQYVPPAGFLFGAVGSLIRRRKNKDSVELLDSDDANSSANGCPNRGSPMKLRTARRGESIGGKFYGCSNFPKCRGTRPFS
jgi:restriction system protein